MSFGRPPTFSNFSVLPPERGSFPLDHEGECRSVMLDYLRCMKTHKNDNGLCRHLSKKYLECRMERGLMEKDDMRNLGFQEQDMADKVQAQAQQQNQAQPHAQAKKSDRSV